MAERQTKRETCFRLFRKGDEICLLDKVQIASSFADRLAGLIPRISLEPGEGLYLPACGSIHTFFMHLAIDVIFLNDNMKIVQVCQSVPPWRVKICTSASATLEAPAGWALSAKVETGDTLILK